MDRKSFVGQLDKLNISYTDSQIDNLFLLMEDTLETNEKFNLTAIKDRNEFIEKMILDSALATVDLDLDNKEIIDIGTGAGFPGLVIKILNPLTKITLLDSTKKKIDHILDLSSKYGFDVEGVSLRAEDFARKNVERYDYAFARAVASLSILSCSYFNLVAIPPLICLSALFSSSISLTSTAKAGLIFSNRSVKSLCTVLLLIPNFFAVCLTVAFVVII